MLQGSAEWHSARTGKLTASRMKYAMAFNKDGKESKDRADLKVEILCERMTDQVADHFVNPAMRWGTKTEPKAKEAYEELTGELIRNVGFFDHPTIEHCGASPDGLLGHDGLIEIKCPTSATHLQWRFSGVVPAEHKPQMILQLACTGRQWCEFVSFDPRMPEAQQLFIRRYTPTVEEIAEVEKAARKFLAEIEAMFEKVTEQI